MVTYDATSKTFTVRNQPGVKLSQTGGIGTTIFTASGAALSGTADAALTMKARKRKENETEDG